MDCPGHQRALARAVCSRAGLPMFTDPSLVARGLTVQYQERDVQSQRVPGSDPVLSFANHMLS